MVLLAALLHEKGRDAIGVHCLGPLEPAQTIFFFQLPSIPRITKKNKTYGRFFVKTAPALERLFYFPEGKV